MALDIGDQWVGSALSDALKVLARPYKTVSRNTLNQFIEEVCGHEVLEEIVVGHPKTMSGTSSEQTRKIEDAFAELQKRFPTMRFTLWDERLSSKRAESVSPSRTSQEKLKSHSIAAAFILDSYLMYVRYHRVEST